MGRMNGAIIMVMDVLSDVLGALRLKGSLYFSTEFRPPWGLRVPSFRRVARFHLVVRGGCWVRIVPTDDLIWLESGDLVLIPHGAEHVLADTPDTPCRTVDEVVQRAGFTGEGALVYGGEDEGGPTRLVCGHFEFDDALTHPWIAQLPASIVIRWDDYTRDSPLEDSFRFIVREVNEGRPGNAAVVSRLSEVLFVQAVRYWAEQEQHDPGVFTALADPRVGGALRAIHSEPAHRWTVESLARKAAMSRSQFSDRFSRMVGVSPLQYVTDWRMQMAKRLLSESRLSLDSVARRVGYESGSSFSRVFKKVVGKRPGAYRLEARGGTHGDGSP